MLRRRCCCCCRRQNCHGSGDCGGNCSRNASSSSIPLFLLYKVDVVGFTSDVAVIVQAVTMCS